MVAHPIRPAWWLLAALMAAVLGILMTPKSAAPQVEGEVATLIEERLGGRRPIAAGAELLAPEPLREVYRERRYRPLWRIDARAGPGPDEVLAAIRAADLDGLRPHDYHLVAIETLLRSSKSGTFSDLPLASRADLDLLLSDAVVSLGRDLGSGRVDPESLHASWTHPPSRPDLVGLLTLASDRSVGAALDPLRPAGREYGALRVHLAELRSIQVSGGWPTLPSGLTLKPGDTSEAIAILRRRLALPAPAPGAVERRFDDELENAVRRFQASSGLEVDGIVGRRTRDALNVSIERRIRQVELNLERLRWSAVREARYIEVRIPEFGLSVVENGTEVLAMKVIAGRPDRRTPMFSALMRSVVFSPYWHVPPGITAQDIIPEVIRDPGYLARNRIEVLVGTGTAIRVLDPHSVDWAAVDPAKMPYRFRQLPGPDNSLGLVKFDMPNRHAVFLHDTPHRGLFARAERAFSSGCVRLEHPVELAEFLLRGQSTWDRRSIEVAMVAGRERTISLTRPIPVHIVYLTAWAADDGTLATRADLYGHDPRLDDALRR
jgi:L,D-transpeptidase YcbB